MSLQQLVKKLSDNSVLFSCFFDLILFFLFAITCLDAGPPLTVGYILLLLNYFQGFPFCQAFQYFCSEGCENPKTFLVKFVGTFLARFKFSSFCKCTCIILLNSISQFLNFIHRVLQLHNLNFILSEVCWLHTNIFWQSRPVLSKE